LVGLIIPGPVHEETGTMQVIVDERGRTRRKARRLFKYREGQETDVTWRRMWAGVLADFSNKLQPLYMPIEFDVEGRRGRLRGPGIIEDGRPSTNQ